MNVKTGDKIIVLAGKDRGKQAKILRVLPKEDRVIVEGVNMQKRRQRATKQGQKGQTVETAAPFSVSNVALWCSNCGRGVRVGAKVEKGKKVRICRRCGKQI